MALVEEIVKSLVLGTCVAGAAMAFNNTTRADKDSARLESIERHAEQEAIVSAMGVDQWRDTAIDRLRLQLAAASSSTASSADEIDVDDCDAAEVLTASSSSMDESEPRIFAYAFGDDELELGFAWSEGARLSNSIRVYTVHSLTNIPWFPVGYAYPRNGSTNLVETFLWPAEFPESERRRAAFVSAMWVRDSDGDMLSDGDERFIYGTDPKKPDTDGDGLNDGMEISGFGTNPCNPDTDGDGMFDYWEYRNGFDPLVWEDGTVDSDNDGLSDAEESQLGTNPHSNDSDYDWLPDKWEVDHGLNPTSAEGDDGRYGDPDGDGSGNRFEYENGTDPLNPDSDGDGLIDGVDPNPLVCEGDYANQSEDWIRQNYSANANEIQSVGYANWVDDNIGYDQTNGYCKLIVTFSATPESPVLLRVGNLRVVITEAGEYPFLLDKGVEYSFGTYPEYQSVTYSVVDDLAPQGRTSASSGHESDNWTHAGGNLRFSLPFAGNLGFLCWMPIFYASPDISHMYYSQTFTANLVDYRYAANVAYRWTCADQNVVIRSPNSQTTRVSFSTLPSWRSASIKVTANVGGETLESVLGFTYGEYDEPQVHLNLSLPDAVLVNTNEASSLRIAAASLSFSSDVPTNGMIRISCVSGSEKIATWTARSCYETFSLPRTWDASEFAGTTFYVEGLEASDSLEDVRFKAEFFPRSGGVSEQEDSMTVVDVGIVSLPGAPEEGLVVQLGTSILFHVDCYPTEAETLLSTTWQVRRLKSDGTYEPWHWAVAGQDNEAVYTPQEGGVYQLRVQAQVPTGGMILRNFILSEDEDILIGLRCRGSMSAFGVCDELWQVQLCRNAQGYLGNTEYAFDVNLDGRYGFSSTGRDCNKCNYFVAYRIREVGLPLAVQHGIAGSYPPLANDWAGAEDIPNWAAIDSPCYIQPGYVVGHPAPGNGHCGIVDFDGDVISAGNSRVNKRYPYWLDGTSVFNKLGGDDE